MRATLIALGLAVSGGCAEAVPDDVVEADDPAEGLLFACPGRADCPAGDPAELKVGVAVRDITPACFEVWTDVNGNWAYNSGVDTFEDCGCDRLCPDDPGWTAADEGEGDGVFRPIWLAGFQNNKPAMGVRGAEHGFLGEGDGLEARAVVVQQGATRIALVTMDAIGWMYDDTVRRRALLAEAGLDLDAVVFHSSHSHSAPDSMGIYGRLLTETGYDPVYAAQVDDVVVDAVTEAVAGLTDVATLRWGVADANEHVDGGVFDLVSDTRDPRIVDPRVGAMQFLDADGETLATLVHWANHPETIGSRNALISSGFVHGVRRVVSEGSRWSDDSGMDGVGGTTVYLNGTVGGMMTSLHAPVIDPTGFQPDDDSWDKTDTVGQMVGELALLALEDAHEVVVAADGAPLWILGKEIELPVTNTGFQLMFSLGVLDHRTAHGYDTDAPLDETNVPYVRSEVDLLGLGPLRMVTMPGEVLPELVIGGYDGAWLPEGADLVDPDGTTSLIEDAPDGPYLGERLGGELSWVLGLGNDEVGYVIPPHDFVVGRPPYLSEADGHYEETNSLGPETWGVLEAAAVDLLDVAAAREAQADQ